MQFAHTPITKLRDREAWKVEYFLAPSKVRRDLASPLLPVGELVSERRESLEPSQFPDFLFNYVGLEHVEGLTGDLVSFDPVSGRQIRSRSKIFRAGDVLYGRLRPYLNKVFVAEGSVTTGICSGEFYVLIPRQE